MRAEKYYIEKYRQIVGEQLGWGNSEDWQNKDFENLSEKIFSKTNIQISTSTLKRIWGKVKYDSSPNLATLDALARFLDYESWRAFVSFHEEAEKKVIPPTTGRVQKKSPLIFYSLAGGLLLILSVFAFRQYKKSGPRLVFNDVIFESKPVVLGVPNTVVFNYDATHSNADSVAIQQSWDRRRRFSVDKSKHAFTSVYYQPGYFKAKLILNDSIVKEHDLFIESGGWLGLIEKSDVPIYFSKEEITKTDGIGLSSDQVVKKGIDFDKVMPWISFFNVSKNNMVPASHCTMEVAVQQTTPEGKTVCQKSYIVLLCTNGFIAVPLSIPGCSGEMNLYLGNLMLAGQTHDLSAFGVDFSDFVKLKLVLADKQITIYINDRPVYATSLMQDMGQVVGTQIRFMGAGRIKDFKLQ